MPSPELSSTTQQDKAAAIFVYILEDNVSGKLLSPSCSSLHLSNLHPQQHEQHHRLNSSSSLPKASVLSVQTSWPCPPLLKFRCFRTCSGVPTRPLVLVDSQETGELTKTQHRLLFRPVPSIVEAPMLLNLLTVQRCTSAATPASLV
ncbi:hypothetical protein EV1_002773 [Malus domestica]